MGEGCFAENVRCDSEECLNLDLSDYWICLDYLGMFSRVISLQFWLNNSTNPISRMHEDFKYKELTEKIIGCAMKVHRTMKNGFQEVIYQRCLEIELLTNNMVCSREHEMPIYYEGRH